MKKYKEWKVRERERGKERRKRKEKKGYFRKWIMSVYKEESKKSKRMKRENIMGKWNYWSNWMKKWRKRVRIKWREKSEEIKIRIILIRVDPSWERTEEKDKILFRYFYIILLIYKVKCVWWRSHLILFYIIKRLRNELILMFRKVFWIYS